MAFTPSSFGTTFIHTIPNMNAFISPAVVLLLGSMALPSFAQNEQQYVQRNDINLSNVGYRNVNNTNTLTNVSNGSDGNVVQFNTFSNVGPTNLNLQNNVQQQRVQTNYQTNAAPAPSLAQQMNARAPFVPQRQQQASRSSSNRSRSSRPSVQSTPARSNTVQQRTPDAPMQVMQRQNVAQVQVQTPTPTPAVQVQAQARPVRQVKRSVEAPSVPNAEPAAVGSSVRSVKSSGTTAKAIASRGTKRNSFYRQYGKNQWKPLKRKGVKRKPFKRRGSSVACYHF